MNRRAAEAAGRRAEEIAAWWLRLHGWRILGRRVRTRAGEIDLVARRGATVTFVEVKARGSRAALDEAIDEHRLVRVAAAAESLIPRFAPRGETVRIDVVLVAPGCWPRHLANVWQGDRAWG